MLHFYFALLAFGDVPTLSSTVVTLQDYMHPPLPPKASFKNILLNT